jgi:hypothetical protein
MTENQLIVLTNLLTKKSQIRTNYQLFSVLPINEIVFFLLQQYKQLRGNQNSPSIKYPRLFLFLLVASASMPTQSFQNVIVNYFVIYFCLHFTYHQIQFLGYL